MHIKQFELRNIRGIDKLRVKFDQPAGWHVFIGDNGSGKSTLLRALAFAIIGKYEATGLRIDFSTWVAIGSKMGSIDVVFDDHPQDVWHSGEKEYDSPVTVKLEIFNNDRKKDGNIFTDIVDQRPLVLETATSEPGWFSCAYGPFRRFTGGASEWEKVFYSNPRAAAHLSVFGEDVALTESIAWLQKLKYRSLEEDKDATYQLANFTNFINQSSLLPHGSFINQISSAGVFINDGDDNKIPLNEMSDGFRSILSLTFELLRQLVKSYGARQVFKKVDKDEFYVDLPGVVLIDEVDVHLHPSWQTRIGEWFIEKFPNIQFIVTTHSPLICRAAEKGSVWRLAAPGSDQKSERVKGTALNRLIFGNVLDAYGTELFGENTTSSDNATEYLEELARLNMKSLRGKITDRERKRMFKLREMMPTEDLTK